MDGLNVSTSQALLESGRTVSQLRDQKFRSDGQIDAGQDVASGSFADTLSAAVNKVNELQIDANTQMEKLATGQAQSVPDVMVAAEKADIAMRLLMTVRNKAIEAYQEMMKMQV